MIILGICNDETASACLMINGEIVCAVSEERFTRLKLDNSFPEQSINFCLSFANIQLSDVDTIAYAWAKGFQSDLVAKFVELGARYYNNPDAQHVLKERIKWEIDRDNKKRSQFDDWCSKYIDLSKQKIMDFYHHEAHAASASFFSPFDNGFVYTSDGRGDFEATTIYKFERFGREKLKKLYSSTSSDSFGFFYGRITGLLGFKPMRHEGKITGLAAYGNPSEAIELCKKMIDVCEGKVVANLGEYYRPFFGPYTELLKKEINKYAKEDVAAAAQRHLEEMMVNLIDFYLKDGESKTYNLMCAGGVFGNVRVTQKLKNMSKIKACYVQPQMGDGGLCLGACALAFEKNNFSQNKSLATTKQLTSMYLGPKALYREKRHEDYLEKFQYESLIYSSAPSRFAKSLRQKNVIGLINGRMEFGPRALCNRSIIVGTSDKTINDWLNKRMHRTEFMPFAPVLRKEVANRCIKNFSNDDVTLNFMTSTVDCTKEFQKSDPAVVHIDQTARPQVVTEESNNFMWNVLREWEKISSEFSLVNTSFNIHEEPIICDVDEGMLSLQKNVIDQLWVVDIDVVHVYYKRK
jgi:carbamoyltransferase